MVSELVKIRKGTVEGLQFQKQCVPFIISKVKGLLQKHPDGASTEDTNGTWGAPCQGLPKAPIQTLRPPLIPKPVFKSPGFLHSSGVVFAHLFIHVQLFMFPLRPQRVAEAILGPPQRPHPRLTCDPTPPLLCPAPLTLFCR